MWWNGDCASRTTDKQSVDDILTQTLILSKQKYKSPIKFIHKFDFKFVNEISKQSASSPLLKKQSENREEAGRCVGLFLFPRVKAFCKEKGVFESEEFVLKLWAARRASMSHPKRHADFEKERIKI